VSLRIPSSSRSPGHDPHRTIYYLGYPLGRFAGLKHRQLARQVGVIITTGRIRRTLATRSIYSSTTPHVRVPRHVVQLVTRLVVDYFNYAARPGASAHCAAHHATCRVTHRRLLRLAQVRRRLLHLHRAFGCLGTSRGSSRGSSSTTSTTPRVRVPRHVVRLITRLVA
jgi:hypothetical protein